MALYNIEWKASAKKNSVRLIEKMFILTVNKAKACEIVVKYLPPYKLSI